MVETRLVPRTTSSILTVRRVAIWQYRLVADAKAARRELAERQEVKRG